MKKKKGPKQEAAGFGLSACALALALVAVPLVWTRWVYAFYVLPKFILAAAAALLMGLAWMRGEFVGGAGRRLELLFGLGWMVLLASALFSVDPYASVFGRYNDHAYGLAALLLYTLAFFWGVGLVPQDRTRFALWAAAAGAAVGLIALFQKMGFRPLLQFDLPGGRAVATIGSPVHLGAYLAGSLVLALPLSAEPRRAFRLFCCAAITAGLWASFSRGAWVAAAVGICVVFLPAAASQLDGRRRFVTAALGAAALVAVFAGSMIWGGFRAVGSSDAVRKHAWAAALSIIGDNPLLGSGPDTFGVEFRKRKTPAFVKLGGDVLRHEHAHNDMLQAAATTGLVGLLAYIALLLALLFEFRRRWENAPPEGRTRALRFLGVFAAVFVAHKFNPISLEVLFLAALAAGAALAALSPPGTPVQKRGAGFAAAAAAGVVLAAGVWLFAADAYSQRGRMLAGPGGLNAHRRSGSLNPCETQYTRRYLNALLDLARENRAHPSRFQYLDEARAAVERTLVCRPGAFEARYAAGFAALLEAQLGRPERIAAAEAHIDAALALDPTFRPLLELGAAAARTAGDFARAEAFAQAADF